MASEGAERTPYQWEERRHHGIKNAHLPAWRAFDDVIDEVLRDKPHVIFRGEKSTGWRLESQYARLLRRTGEGSSLKSILNSFKYASRGRLRPEDTTMLGSDDEWWALGRHHGLATPLLDFTASPYVALFFAFEEVDGGSDGKRVVYALNVKRLLAECDRLEAEGLPRSELPQIVKSYSHINSRLVNQAGVFLKLADTCDLTEWLRKHVPEDYPRSILARLLVSSTDREGCLKTLSLMNVNHLSLFPDLEGAGKYVNLMMAMPGYGRPA